MVSRGPEASMTSHHCRKPCTESLTEHPTKWSEKYFLILGFEKVLEEEASKEERGPATSSEDRDGPKTARGSPVVHLSRYKSCGDNNLHTSTQWGQESWGKCSRPGPPNFKPLQSFQKMLLLLHALHTVGESQGRGKKGGQDQGQQSLPATHRTFANFNENSCHVRNTFQS